MVLEEVVVNSADALVRNLVSVIAALGGIIVIYLIFQIINFSINRKKLNKIKVIDEKIDKIMNLLEKKKK